MLALRWGTSDICWPLAKESARAAWRVLLSPDDESARSALATALAVDPPLAGWMLVQARRKGQPLPRSLDPLAAWIAAAGAEVWLGVELQAIPVDELSAWRRFCQEAVRAAQATGEDASGWKSPQYLAALIRRLPPPGAALKIALDPEAPAAAPLESDDLDAGLLPALVARLSRLAKLERDLAAVLETEKLASLAELAAGAGHEINNPLAVITGRAELLLRGGLNAEQRHDLAVIHTQALRVRTLISDLMLFARPPKLRLSTTDLGPLVARVLDEMQPLAQERQIALSGDFPGEPLTSEIDGVQIEVALRALLDNALEATPAGGSVVVRVEPSETPDGVRLSVADTGPGISAEVRRHLFDPFYSGRQAGRGLGFGLAKCWRIVTLHGGTIAAGNRDDGPGARFVLELPRAL